MTLMMARLIIHNDFQDTSVTRLAMPWQTYQQVLAAGAIPPTIDLGSQATIMRKRKPFAPIASNVCQETSEGVCGASFRTASQSQILRNFQIVTSGRCTAKVVMVSAQTVLPATHSLGGT